MNKENTLKNSQILYDGMKMIIDEIKANVFYDPLHSNQKPDYKLSIDNQKKQSNDIEFFTPQKRSRDTLTEFNKLIV